MMSIQWMHSSWQFKWFWSGELFISPNSICTHFYWETSLHLSTPIKKKQKMKIMGRVARLIFVVVVSVCVVFCVLCCLQNNPVFSSVTIFHILKNENYELCFLANFFVDQITTRKNYDRKKKVLC